MSSVIELRELEKSYFMAGQAIPVLKGINLDILKNEYVALMGPSGSGKSTLMNILGCLDSPTSGMYNLNGHDVSKMTDDELIWSYLEMNKYNPVSFGVKDAAASPEDAKVLAMANFVNYVKAMAVTLQKAAFLKKDVANKFIPKKPTIGFSDDDEKNVDSIKKYFNSIKEPIKLYSTKGGIKKEIN